MRNGASFSSPGRAKPKTAPHAGIRPLWFYGMFTLLLAGNALTGTALLFSPEIAKVLNGQTEQVIQAYEDRIAQLRVEVDRLHSRSYAQAGDINLQLQELSQQQEMLLEQHQLVKVLVDKAGELGIQTAALGSSPGEVAMAAPTNASGNPDIDETARALAQMMGETEHAMTSIAQTATERTTSIVNEMAEIGIRVSLPDALDGVGGPLLAPSDGGDAAPMIEDANAVMAALVRYKAARESIDAAPIHLPIAGTYRQSSGFGNRRDPFSGKRAFHSGLDFAARSGTTVLSAGQGVVTFVGVRSGYGNVVEVTHPSGLVTRYGHLSGFLSSKGQKVHTGTPIAKVGSTGRSTGPHLHFEVRQGSRAMDPKQFMEAGKRLQALLG
ncbi:M23 family metallopeptidase [Devosia sp. 1566]|uniref:M23 family metallopeptidase n=1 Tax=Devosia sp. 1566 TaxID=2499144 RepID=UPI000FDA9069|nr:M23 family metallopeptidase [Devosia sp. 1566]